MALERLRYKGSSNWLKFLHAHMGQDLKIGLSNIWSTEIVYHGPKKALGIWILVKREDHINKSKLTYPSVSLLQSGDISNDKAEAKRYLGCEKSLMVSCVPEMIYRIKFYPTTIYSDKRCFYTDINVYDYYHFLSGIQHYWIINFFYIQNVFLI